MMLLPVFGAKLKKNFSIVAAHIEMAYQWAWSWIRNWNWKLKRQCLTGCCECTLEWMRNAFGQPRCAWQTKWMAWHHVLECWCLDNQQMFSHQHAFHVIAKYHVEFTIFWLYALHSLKLYGIEMAWYIWIDSTCCLMYGWWYYVPPLMYNYKFIVKSHRKTEMDGVRAGQARERS